jgi:predicted RecA/RadA family phage recombinase
MARTCYKKIDKCAVPTRQYTNATGTAIGAGTLIKLNISATQCIAGVTEADIANGATGMIDDKSVFAIPCAHATAFAEGARVCWNAEASLAIAYATLSGTDDFLVGSCYKTKGTADLPDNHYVWVQLNHGAEAFLRQSS